MYCQVQYKRLEIPFHRSGPILAFIEHNIPWCATFLGMLTHCLLIVNLILDLMQTMLHCKVLQLTQ